MLGCFYSNLEDLLRKGNHEEDAQIQMQIDDMMETGLLRGFPLAYISGMSIKNSFIICDEAQNIGRYKGYCYTVWSRFKISSSW